MKKQNILIIICISVALISIFLITFSCIKIIQSNKKSDKNSDTTSNSNIINNPSDKDSNDSVPNIADSYNSSDSSKAEADDTFINFIHPNSDTVETDEMFYNFSGSCTKNIKLTVNGKNVECNKDGSFLYKAELLYGENIFTFKQGNTEKKITVYRKVQKTDADKDTNEIYTKTDSFVYHERDSLGHTHKKLTEDKELTVVYYGGSVTAGYGASYGYSSAENGTSWACLLTKWLKTNFKDAKIKAYNSAIGATGTHVGVYRLKEDVIKYNPDLIFIEFAINDHYCGTTESSAALQFETIVRELRLANPKCDIVTVLTTDSYTSKEKYLFTSASAHEKISEHYRISSVNVGQYVLDLIEKNGEKWNNYFIDIVHPNDKGYYEYAACLTAFLENQLIKTDYSSFTDTAKPLPSIKSSYLLDGDRKSLTGEQLKASLIANETVGFDWINNVFEGHGGAAERRGYYRAYSLDSQISFSFSGTELAIWTNLRKSSKIKFSIDGGEWQEISCSDNSPTQIIKGLSSGNHTIKIVPTDFGNISSLVFNIHAVFTRDSTKQTHN